jgi:hypothetical protein
MCVLLLDAGWLCGKGAAKWNAVDGNLAVEWQKDEQQKQISSVVLFFWETVELFQEGPLLGLMICDS